MHVYNVIIQKNMCDAPKPEGLIDQPSTRGNITLSNRISKL